MAFLNSVIVDQQHKINELNEKVKLLAEVGDTEPNGYELDYRYSISISTIVSISYLTNYRHSIISMFSPSRSYFDRSHASFYISTISIIYTEGDYRYSISMCTLNSRF